MQKSDMTLRYACNATCQLNKQPRKLINNVDPDVCTARTKTLKKIDKFSKVDTTSFMHANKLHIYKGS